MEKFLCIGAVLLLIFSLIQEYKHRKEKRKIEYQKACEDKFKQFLKDIDYYAKVSSYLTTIFNSDKYDETLEVSRQLVSNFRKDKTFEYLVKYFGLIVNTDSLQSLENMLFLIEKIEKYVNNSEVNLYFEYPYKAMRYESPAGNSKDGSLFLLTSENIKLVIDEIDNIHKRKTCQTIERNKITPIIRDSILARDNFTCAICGNSLYKEPNLLLEVGHIIPISKGGKTEPNNLQTLCWRCNRKKSSNIN